MIVIGVAGGIASGKSIVCRLFEDFGGRVIDADIIGHEILVLRHIRNQLIRAFGHGIINKNGKIDRSSLGRIVFSDTTARERLNAIVHPPLVAEIRRRINVLRSSPFDGVGVVNAALLVEWGATDLVDVVVIVTAPESMRIARLIERNNITPDEAVQRVAAQLTDEERIRYAHYVIDNRGNLEELERQTKMTWQRIMKGREQ